MAQVRFFPAGKPPHRREPAVSPRQRLEMAGLAVAGNSLFVLDDREVRKPTPSYTVETLLDLRRELGSDRPLCLFMGGDAFLGLTTWHRWRDLLELAHIVVARRPGFPPLSQADMPEALKAEVRGRLREHVAALRSQPAGAILAYTITALDISATGIREMVRRGESPRYLLPDAVLDYIQANGLYGGTALPPPGPKEHNGT